MKAILLILTILVSPQIYAENIIGQITKLKGFVKRDKMDMRSGDKIYEGDTLQVEDASFVRVKLSDNTQISLGPNSEFIFKKNKISDGKRDQVFNLIKGKMRAIINKKATKGEKIRFKVKNVSLGVRGTEFINSAYSIKGVPSADTTLLRGKLAVKGQGTKAYGMKAGTSFNSAELASKGKLAFKKVPPGLLKKLLANPDSFLPNIQLPDGAFSSLTSMLGSVASGLGVAAAATAVLGDSDEKKEEPEEALEEVEGVKEEKANGLPLTTFEYDLSKEKWDIRDALVNRKKYRKDNKCFYYFFKTLPGGGEEERFRRERDCDEFENDL